MENRGYRRNEQMGNMGIIPNDSNSVRRRTILQEQQREEIRRRNNRNKKISERRRRKRRRQMKVLWRYACIFAAVILVIWMMSLKKGKHQTQDLFKPNQVATTESVQQDSGTLSDASAQNTVAVVSRALPDYYQKKYIIDVPTHYSSEEITDKLQNLAQQYPEFSPIVENKDQYPEALLNNLCYNPNMLDFALGYLDNLDVTDDVLEESELAADIPLFIQWDKRWGYKLYGSSVVGLVGCGPTCMAMVVTGLTKNKRTTPDVLAAYAESNGYYVYGAGTSWSFMDDVGSLYGIQAARIPISKERVMDELGQKHPIICSMNPGDFTAEGHFIVLAGLADGNKIRINDPNSIERSNMLWDYDDIESQISGMWAYQLVQ